MMDNHEDLQRNIDVLFLPRPFLVMAGTCKFASLQNKYLSRLLFFHARFLLWPGRCFSFMPVSGGLN